MSENTGTEIGSQSIDGAQKSQKRDSTEIGEEGEGPQRTHTSYYNSKGEELTFVQAREKRLNLDSDVGKKKIIKDATKESESGGYWCDVCKCSLKDNRSWLDHINGRKHQQHLGRLMRVEYVDVNTVKEKLASLKSEKPKVSMKDLLLKRRAERLQKEKEEQEEKEKQKEKQKQDEEGSNPADESSKELEELIGFSSFGTKKKK